MTIRRRSLFWEFPMTDTALETLAKFNEQQRQQAIARLGERWVLAKTRRIARVWPAPSRILLRVEGRG